MENDRESLAKHASKGYLLIWILDPRSDGGESIQGKRRGRQSPELREGAAAIIADGTELAGAGGLGAPGSGFPLREHREREEVTASSPRGKTWSEAETARFVGLNAADRSGHRLQFSTHVSSRERGVGSRTRNGRRAEARAQARPIEVETRRNHGEVGNGGVSDGCCPCRVQLLEVGERRVDSGPRLAVRE